MDISIIIPTYNVEKYIRCTLDSIVNQTFQNFEVIIIDDGSIDNTYDILKEYSQKYTNIFAEKISYSRGPGKARNIGLKKAKGKYIYFVDGDDFVPHDALEKLYRYSEENNADITLGKVFFKDKDFIYSTQLINMIFKDNSKINVKFRQWPQLKYLQGPVAKLYRRSYLEEINFKYEEEMFFEDFPIVGLAYYLTDKIYLMYEYVYGIRVRDEKQDPSITQTVDVEITKKDLAKAKELELELMGNHNIKHSQTQLNFFEYIKKKKEELKQQGKEYKDLFKEIDKKDLPESIKEFL